jgi:predicted RNA polymerase sigma factor
VADELRHEPQLRDYHLLPSVRGDLLFRLGRYHDARTEFERPASMTRNIRERALLRQRAEESFQRAAKDH